MRNKKSSDYLERVVCINNKLLTLFFHKSFNLSLESFNLIFNGSIYQYSSSKQNQKHYIKCHIFNQSLFTSYNRNILVDINILEVISN